MAAFFIYGHNTSCREYTSPKDNVRYFSHIEEIDVAAKSVKFGYRQTPPNQREGLQMEVIRANGKKKVPVIAVDEEELRTRISEVVRQSVEETLNGLLDAM